LAAGSTNGLRKVTNFRGEQNGLESPAKDSESLVCKVSETLSIVKKRGIYPTLVE
jgi:hypothetical protein